jgi:hypothetical protein
MPAVRIATTKEKTMNSFFMAFLLSFPQRGFQKADRKIRETNIGETRGIVNLGSIGGKENPPVLAPLVEFQAGGFSGHHP